MWQARDGKPRLLLTRMRANNVTREELCLAADLIEGNIKPRRLRKDQPSSETKLAIASMAWLLRLQFRIFQPRSKNVWPMKKKIIPMVAEAHGVSTRLVEKLMLEYGDHGIEELIIDRRALHRIGLEMRRQRSPARN
jgi:hypothetical protein